MINTALSPPFVTLLLSIGWFSFAYLLGSIPMAWLLTKWVTGQDLRHMGSGNVGVMNTAFSVARWIGLCVFITEIAKGFLAVIVPRLLGEGGFTIGLTIAAVVIGSRWPIWLGFKGGRGNTTGMAACLLISYQSLLAVISFWLIARFVLKKSFIATRITLLAIPVIFWAFTRSTWFALTGLALSLLYLDAQRAGSDDHLRIKQQWSSFWKFLTTAPRRKPPLP